MLSINEYDEIKTNFDVLSFLCDYHDKKYLIDNFFIFQIENGIISEINLENNNYYIVVKNKKMCLKLSDIFKIFLQSNCEDVIRRYKDIEKIAFEDYSYMYNKIEIRDDFFDVYSDNYISSCMSGQDCVIFYNKMNDLAGYDLVKIMTYKENDIIKARALLWNLIPPENSEIKINVDDVPSDWNGLFLDRCYGDQEYRNAFKSKIFKEGGVYKTHDSAGYHGASKGFKKFKDFKFTINFGMNFFDFASKAKCGTPYIDSPRIFNKKFGNECISYIKDSEPYSYYFGTASNSEFKANQCECCGEYSLFNTQNNMCEKCLKTAEQFVCSKTGKIHYVNHNVATEFLDKFIIDNKISLKYLIENKLIAKNSNNKYDFIVSRFGDKFLFRENMLKGDSLCERCGKRFKGKTNVCESCAKQMLDNEENKQINILFNYEKKLGE